MDHWDGILTAYIQCMESIEDSLQYLAAVQTVDWEDEMPREFKETFQAEAKAMSQNLQRTLEDTFLRFVSILEKAQKDRLATLLAYKWKLDTGRANF